LAYRPKLLRWNVTVGGRLLRIGSLLQRAKVDNAVAVTRAALADTTDDFTLASWIREEAEKRGHVLPLDMVARMIRIARKPTVPKEAEGRLAVIACHFNPAGWQRPTDNYLRFLHEMRWWRLPLFTAEVAYAGQAFPTPDAWMHIKATDAHRLWQKERLLNLLVESLPACFTRVAWIDADVIFLDPRWPERLEELLRHHAVVQLWNRWHCPDATGAVCEVLTSVGPGGSRYDADRPISPGGAWAARRSVFPLYDRHIVGSGDAMALEGWMGLEKSQCMRRMNPAMAADFSAWAHQAHRKVRGRIGALPGDTVHMYHGTRANRQYVDRWGPVIDAGFDPVAHVKVDTNGLLAWTDDAPPQLVDWVRSYFHTRQEDQ